MQQNPDPESTDENRHNLQNKSELRVTSLESHRILIFFRVQPKCTKNVLSGILLLIEKESEYKKR